MESCEIVVALHDLYVQITTLLGPGHQLPGVTTVRPDQCQTLEPISDPLEQQLGSITVLNSRRVNHNGENQSHDVHRQMSLASGDLFARVVTVDPALLIGLGRLAVKDRGSGFGVSTRLNPNLVSERLMDQFPGSITLPATRVIVDGS